MIVRAVAFILIALLALAALHHAGEPAPLLVEKTDAAWSQPQGRLFAVCPGDARNYDRSRERRA